MQNKKEMNLDRIQPIPKTGQEQLIYNGKPLGFSLIDFWRWSNSDILANTIRGAFAQFIVATATNIDLTILRVECSAYDLKTPEGINLEIKSAAYIQSWFQRKLSIISFSTKPALHWEPLTNVQGKIKKRHANVYVFCLLHHIDKSTIDLLDMNQWEFYVLATEELNNYKRSQHSITLNSLKGLTPAIPYEQLRESIIEKNKLNVI
jgi:hypothetical protein